jgi:MFS family permease
MKRWLSRNVWTLSWVSFLQDAASEMLMPLMPVVLTSILHAPAAVVGMIEGLAEGMAATTKLLSSRINRWVPRKTMVFLGYAGAAMGKVIVALSGTWPMVLAGRLTDRFGKGLRSVARDALLVDGSDRGDRGKIVGFHRTADTLGAVIGPVLALTFLSLLGSSSDTEAIRKVLWFAVVPGVASTLLVLMVRDNQKSKRGQAKADAIALADAVFDGAATEGMASSDTQTSKPAAKTLEPIPGRLKTVLFAMVAFSVVNFPDALVLLHVSQIGFTVQGVIAAYLVYNIAYAALNFPAGWLADRFSPNAIFGLGLVCFAIAYGGMGLTNDHNLTIALLVVYGGFAAANDTVGKSWISKLAPDSRQIWAQSLLQGLSGFSVLAAGLWAGIIWTMTEFGATGAGSLPLRISGIVAIIAAVAVFSIGRDHGKH